MIQLNPLDEPTAERGERVQKDIENCKNEFKAEMASLLPPRD